MACAWRITFSVACKCASLSAAPDGGAAGTAPRIGDAYGDAAAGTGGGVGCARRAAKRPGVWGTGAGDAFT